MDTGAILLLVALVLLVLAAARVGGPIDLTAAGLAFAVLAALVGRGIF
jgi:hypothetical protein